MTVFPEKVPQLVVIHIIARAEELLCYASSTVLGMRSSPDLFIDILSRSTRPTISRLNSNQVVKPWNGMKVW